VDYEPENKSLFLTRMYTQAPPQTAFVEDMKRLMRASLMWSGEVLQRVASSVFKT
jgi:hypothetical protein